LHDTAYAYNILASSYLDIGNINKAIKYRKVAISLYEQLDNIPGLAQAHNNLGASYQSLGNQNLALHHFELSLTLCERIGGEVLLTLGKLDESINHLSKVVETYDLKGDPLAACGLALVNLSRAYQRKQDMVQAFDSLKRGSEMLRRARAKGLLAEALLQQAELELFAFQIEDSTRTCNRVLKDTQELGLKLLQARAFHILGRIKIADELYEQGENYLRQSISLAQSINADYERGIALMHLAVLYSKQAEGDNYSRRWGTVLNQAVKIFRRVGAEADLIQALQIQSNLKSST
jgi:tetratricopeptide (TPR) repeat protein